MLYIMNIIHQPSPFSLEMSSRLQKVVASDNGMPQRESSAAVRFKVVALPKKSSSPPIFTKQGEEVSLMENDAIGDMVTLMSAEDPDHDKLWYSIIGNV